jgi:hypothetical protein
MYFVTRRVLGPVGVISQFVLSNNAVNDNLNVPPIHF